MLNVYLSYMFIKKYKLRSLIGKLNNLSEHQWLNRKVFYVYYVASTNGYTICRKNRVRNRDRCHFICEGNIDR